MRGTVLIFVLITTFFCFTGCKDKEYESVKSSVEEMKKKNTALLKEAETLEAQARSLKAEIETLKYSPAPMLKRGQFYVKAQAWDHAAETLTALKEKHPESEEAKQAETLLAEVEAQKKTIAQKKKALAMQAIKRLRKIGSGGMVQYGGLFSDEAINAHVLVNDNNFAVALMKIEIQMVGHLNWNIKEITIGTRNGPHVFKNITDKITYGKTDDGKTKTTYSTYIRLKEKYMIEDIIARDGARITFTSINGNDAGFDLSKKALNNLRDVFLVYDGLSGRYIK